MTVPAKSAGKCDLRKSGDLTSGVTEIIEDRGSVTLSNSPPRPPIVAVAPKQSALDDLVPLSMDLARSDTLRYNNVGFTDWQIASPTPDVLALVVSQHRSSAPIPFYEADASGDASGPDNDAVACDPCRIGIDPAISPAARATDGCLGEHPRPLRAPAALEPEVLPALRSAASSPLQLVGSEHQSIDPPALPEIVAMALGALLIIVGLALAAAVMWRSSMGPEWIRLGGLGVEISTEGAWFGLAFILIGATLEVVGLRSRRIR